VKTKFHRLIYLSVFVSLLIIFPFQAVRAQDADSTPAPSPAPTEDPEIKRRKDKAALKQAEAEAEEAEANARKANADAREKEIANRKNELELLKGTTTTSGDLIENDITAYQAVACACKPIAKKINDKNGQIKTLMIYSPEIADTLTEYSALIVHMNRLEDTYKEILGIDLQKTPLAPGVNLRVNNAANARASIGIPGLGDIISAAIDILSLFKVDVEITGEKVDVGKEEFISKVVDGLSGIDVYYPDKVIVSKPPTDSTLLEKINSLLRYQAIAKKTLKELGEQRAKLAKGKKEDIAKQIAEKKKEIEKLEAEVRKFPRNRKKRQALNTANEDLKQLEAKLEKENKDTEAAVKKFDEEFGEAIKQLNNLNALVDALLNQFNPPLPGEKDESKNITKTKSLASFLRAETTYQKIAELEKGTQKVYWLDLGVSKAGGNMLKKTSPLLDIFTGGDRVKFSGGTVVSFKVFHSDGQIVVSDMIWAYAPYRKSKYVTEFLCQSGEGITQVPTGKSTKTRQPTLGRAGPVIP